MEPVIPSKGDAPSRDLSPQGGSQIHGSSSSGLEVLVPPHLGSPEPTWWLCVTVTLCGTARPPWPPHRQHPTPPALFIHKSQLLLPSQGSGEGFHLWKLNPGVPRDSLCVFPAAPGEENSIFYSKKKRIITGFCATHKIPALIGRAGRKGKINSTMWKVLSQGV